MHRVHGELVSIWWRIMWMGMITSCSGDGSGDFLRKKQVDQPILTLSLHLKATYRLNLGRGIGGINVHSRLCDYSTPLLYIWGDCNLLHKVFHPAQSESIPSLKQSQETQSSRHSLRHRSKLHFSTLLYHNTSCMGRDCSLIHYV